MDLHLALGVVRVGCGWHSRAVTRADLDKQPHEVAAMFDGVAERYDLTNTVLSFGQDRGWRRATRAALDLKPGQRVLDVGAGTGVSTEELARSGSYAVGVDLSTGMLRAGRRVRPTVPLLAGDALRLPFPDGAFRTAYLQYLMRSLPAVARRVSSNPDAYVYLAESIRAWPDQAALAGRIGRAGGWSKVGWRNMTGGIAALHRATRS